MLNFLQSYDATTHFESTVKDVLAMYTKITGKVTFQYSVQSISFLKSIGQQKIPEIVLIRQTVSMLSITHLVHCAASNIILVLKKLIEDT